MKGLAYWRTGYTQMQLFACCLCCHSPNVRRILIDLECGPTLNDPECRHTPTAAWSSFQLAEASRLAVCEIGNELNGRNMRRRNQQILTNQPDDGNKLMMSGNSQSAVECLSYMSRGHSGTPSALWGITKLPQVHSDVY